LPTNVLADPIGTVNETTADVGAALGLPLPPVSLPQVEIPTPTAPALPSVNLP
jgi:hypothetical protein